MANLPDEDLDASLYPIAVLLDELKHEDIQLRLNATRRIKTIAEALGPERTRAELLPFITETIDDEDEVVLALAEELGDFLEEVGGTQHAHVLVLPLEALATVEETIIRDKAVESICHLSSQVATISEHHARTLHVDHLYPLLQRLGTGDWFTSRISACALCSDFYKRIPDDRPDLRDDILSLYKSLASDETPMVRRAAASNISPIARAINAIAPSVIRTDLLPIFAALVDDEQDSVRLLVVENAAVFAALLASSPSGQNEMSADTNGPTAATEDSAGANSDPSAPATAETATSNGPASHSDTDRIVQMVKAFAVDKSWRVRYMVANQLSDLCQALGPDATRSDLLPAYISVLKDNEPEVRTAAAYKITEVVKRIVALPPKQGHNSGIDHAVFDILPLVEQLLTDSSQHVRAALASNIMGLAPVVGVDVTLSHLVEVVLSLLKDEFPEVRLNVIARLDKVSFLMSIDKLSNELLPAIVDLAEDKNWRVRLAIIEHIPLLARQLGKDFFEKHPKLRELCIGWLGDCVYSIREAGIANLKSLTEIFGLDWAKLHIIPQVMEMYDKSSNYLLRMTALHAIGVLSEVVGVDIVEDSFLPIVTDRASRDPVPNVRFCSAKTLSQVIPFVRQNIRESKIRPCLMNLVGESEKDKDVAYFAQQALLKLSSCAT